MSKSESNQLTKPQWLRPYTFAPVVKLPSHYYVHDFTQGPDPIPPHIHYSVGRYNEVRKNMYESEIFVKENRNIHMGIDIAAPIGESVFSFYDGEILFLKDNTTPGDYGPTIITKHIFSNTPLYALYGHLSLESLLGKKVGQKIKTGVTLGFVGEEKINGGWFPHLHFQLSLKEPTSCDMLGVVSATQRDQALQIFPDPQWVLGTLY